MMKDHPVEDPSLVRWLWLCRAPLLIAAALICLISGFNLYRLTVARAPRNPWESVEVLEAYRSLRGMPVYELGPDGHATHMYGALVPWLQGQIFRWVGPNNISGRLITLVSALATVSLLAVTMRGDRSAWCLAVAWAALLGVNHRSGQYFAENRPDMLALFVGAVGLLLIGFGQEKRRWMVVLLGSVGLVVGFFLKQVVSVFAVVPLVVLVLRGRRPDRSEVVLAAIPPAVMVAVILGLRVFSPVLYHYMIVVPGSYRYYWPRIPRYAWELLLDSPLFLILFGEWIIAERASLRADPRLLWLAAVLAVSIPFCAMAFGKVGGWPNSLLPALLAMMAFAALRLPRLLKRIDDRAWPLHSRLVLGVFLAFLMMMTTFPHLTKANNLLVPRSPRDREYERAIAVVRGLAGTVACPEDPTIPLYAKRQLTQNLFAEKDARADRGNWPTAIPESVLAELREADYVVDVTDYWGENIDEDLLHDRGFEPMGWISLDPRCYRIWHRTAENTARTAYHAARESHQD
jgi:hypothetical protein